MVDVQINYLSTPATISNQALDLLGVSGQIIGSLTDGTKVAETARRNYGQALRQLLRASWWNFARKRAKLTLLGTRVIIPPPLGVSPFVEWPWLYAYALPTDCLLARWLPYGPTSNQPTNAQGVPLTTAPSVGFLYPQIPGRFLITSTDQYPTETGFTPWDELPDFQRTVGVGPTTRQVVLTDCCDAWLVYTALIPTIENWDALFRQAMVTMMALILAPVAIEDPKLRLAEIARLTPMLKNAVDNARASSANEAGFPQTVNKQPEYVTARNRVSGWGPFGGEALVSGNGGTLYGSWESFACSGSVF